MPAITLGRDARMKPLAGSSVDWGHPMTRGLVFATLFNECAGVPNVTHDLVTGRTSASVGVATRSWCAGINGPAFAFTQNTDGSYLDFGDLTQWDPVSGFTGSALVRWNTGSSDGCVMAKLDISPYNGWMIWKVSANYASVYVNGGVRASGASGPTIANGQWIRVTVVWDGATIFLYHDNRLATSGAYSTAPTSAGKTLKLNDYTGNAGAGNAFCTYSDAFYWTRALRAAEIAQLCAAPYAMFGPNRRIWTVDVPPPPFVPYRNQMPTLIAM